MTRPVKVFTGVGWITWYILFSMWLGCVNSTPELFEGFSVSYVLEVLMFPLFAALLTTTVRVWQKK
jgi:hypothetical protein